MSRQRQSQDFLADLPIIGPMFDRARSVLVRSPVVIGGSVVLLGLIMAMLAFNATTGLPFIKTYDIFVPVPDGQRLTTGADVRVGGTRVGQLAGINARIGADKKPYTELVLRLDRKMEPVLDDSDIKIRPTSMLGGKYIEFIPGEKGKPLKFGDTLPGMHKQASINIDEVTNIFDQEFRDSYAGILETASQAFAGRSSELNEAYGELPKLLERSAKVLSFFGDPETNLAGWIRGTSQMTQGLLPVLFDFAPLISNSSATLAAFADSETSIKEVLDEAPSTLDKANVVLPKLTPTLREAAALAKDARAATANFPRIADALNGASIAALPVMKESAQLPPAADGMVAGLKKVIDNPNLDKSVPILTGMVDSVVGIAKGPVGQMQKRCNYMGLFLRNGESVLSDGDKNGNWFRASILLNLSEMLPHKEPTADGHYSVYPDTIPGKCSAGYERYEPGRRMGTPLLRNEPANVGISTGRKQ